MKKKVSIVLLVVCFILSSGFAFAMRDGGNIGVSTVNPTEKITLYGRDVPDDEWNIADEGEYFFQGKAGVSVLYTNYLLTGKERYSIDVTNYSDDDLTVRVIEAKVGFDKVLKTETVSGNHTLYFSITNLDKNDNIYIEFDPPSDFSGHIK